MRVASTRSVFCFTFCVTLVAFYIAVYAQQEKKIPRIGIITDRGRPGEPGSSIKLFQQALHDFGYSEGKNIFLEHRYSEGKRDRIPGILAELISLKSDIIFSTQAIVIRAAKQATKTIPIVMAITVDPVAAGLVDSFARPGGNITGVTRFTRELSGKRLELLREIIPGLSRVGIVSTAGATAFKQYEPAARTLKVTLQLLEVQGPDVSKALQIAAKERLEAIIATSVPGLAGLSYQRQIANLAIKNRLPLMSETITIVDAGGLVSYDADRDEIFKRAAFYVDKILKGARPADLPVEQASKFEFVINLKTAKQIGLDIPQWVLLKADRVIR
jgi:putative ABC transport system substrate-binding protein